MEVTISYNIKGPGDVEMFNHLNIWCAQRAVYINSQFNGEKWDTTIRGDRMVLIDMFAYLTEIYHAGI